MKNKKKYYDTFGGHKVSDCGLKYGRVDYATFAKCFDAVLCNGILEAYPLATDQVVSGGFFNYYYKGDEISEKEYYELEGQEDTDFEELEDKAKDFFQFYIVGESALYFLREAKETVLYCKSLDVYIWCVDHWGTTWDSVLTSIKLKEREG